MRRWLVAFAALAALGCGGDLYKLASVSGRVTLDDHPLSNAHVNFQPLASGGENPGPGSYAKTDADGRFTLKVAVDGRSGAVVGRHQVRISALGGESSKQSDAGVIPPRDDVPPWYNRDSRLTFDVPPGGTDRADFVLTRKPPR